MTAARGGVFELRAVPSDDPGMSPHGDLVQRGAGTLCAGRRGGAAATTFQAICERERCPVCRGRRGDRGRSICWLGDRHFGNRPVDMPLAVLFGKPPKMLREVHASSVPPGAALGSADIDLGEAVFRVLRLPTVADKSFLITIGDRSVTGHGRARSDGRPLAGAGGRLWP